MLQTTTEAINSIMRADPTISPDARARILKLLRQDPGHDDPLPRLLRRAEVARLLGRSKRSVDSLAKRSLIRRVTFPGQQRAAGYLLEDVKALLEGRQ